MKKQDNDDKDLLTIEELAERAMAEADSEADSHAPEDAPDDADDDSADDEGSDDSGKTPKERKGRRKSDKAKTAKTAKDSGQEHDGNSENEEETNDDGDDGKPDGDDEDSLKKRLREYVDDDDASPLDFKFSLKAIVGGDGLGHLVARNWVFISVIVFFTCCYVTSRYMMQGATIEHSNLKKQLVDRKIKAVTATSQYMEKTRLQYIEENLQDTTLHASTDIPYSLHVD